MTTMLLEAGAVALAAVLLLWVNRRARRNFGGGL